VLQWRLRHPAGHGEDNIENGGREVVDMDCEKREVPPSEIVEALANLEKLAGECDIGERLFAS